MPAHWSSLPMHGYFILILGVAVFLLHIPGLLIPEPHRRLGERFVQSNANLRMIGVLMGLIAVIAVVVSPDSGATKWLLYAFSLYMAASGLFLIFKPGSFVERSAKLFSAPIKMWKARAAAKCAFALILVAWGVSQLPG